MKPTLDPQYVEANISADDALAMFQEHCAAVDATIVWSGNVEVATCNYVDRDNVLFAEYDHATGKVYLYLL